MAVNVQDLPKLTNKRPVEVLLDEFDGGTNVLLSETRIAKNEAKESLNLMLIEDGVWTKRWGSKQWGASLVGTIDGWGEYVKTDDTREMLVIDAGTLKKSTDDGATWSTVTGVTFTAGSRAYFYQYGAYDSVTNTQKNYMYIANGVDKIARYDGSTVSRYTQIAAPSASLSATRGGGLSTGSYNYYYVVTSVNSGGETDSSAEFSVSGGVNLQRAQWVDADENVALSWTAVSGAIKYVVYASDLSGTHFFLGETTVNSFVDDGSQWNDQIVPPDSNQTGGPTLKSVTESGNRLWGVGTDNYIHFTGNIGSEKGNFSAGAGGGYVGVARGTKAVAMTVHDVQGKPHVWLKNPEGGGQIWRIDEQTISVAGVDVVVQVPSKVLDATGTNAIAAVIPVENDIFYWDRGVRVLGNEPGVLNVLRTNELSANIRPYIESLQPGGIPEISAFYYKGKVLFSVPYNSTTPDRTIVYDRERTAWIKDWSVGVTQWGVYTESAGTTKLIGSIGNKLYEFSENYDNDDGVAFSTKYVSPRLSVGGKNFTEFAKIKKAYVKLRDTIGNVNITITGTGKTERFSNLATKTISAEGSNTGMSFEPLSFTQLSTSTGMPTTFQSESLIKRIDVKKLVRDIQITISTTGSGNQFTLIGVLFTGQPVNTGDPANWRDD